jgi:hypothetical protein
MISKSSADTPDTRADCPVGTLYARADAEPIISSALQLAQRTPARTAAAAPENPTKIQAWLSIRRQSVRRY